MVPAIFNNRDLRNTTLKEILDLGYIKYLLTLSRTNWILYFNLFSWLSKRELEKGKHKRSCMAWRVLSGNSVLTEINVFVPENHHALLNIYILSIKWLQCIKFSNLDKHSRETLNFSIVFQLINVNLYIIIIRWNFELGRWARSHITTFINI